MVTTQLMDEGVPYLAAECYKQRDNNLEDTADQLAVPKPSKIQLFDTESAISVPKVKIRRNPFENSGKQ